MKSLSALICLFILAMGLSGSFLKAQNPNPWSFRFSVGSLFPDASEIIDANSPNGLNISTGMAFRYRSWLTFQGTAHFDYFSDDKNLDFRSYIIAFNPTFETRIHILPSKSKISPYLMGGVAPGIFVNTKPYIQEGNELDPYTTQRDYDIEVGYTLKYGAGTFISLGEDFTLWAEWQYSRFGFFTGRQPLKYRGFLIGMLLDVEWLL